MFLSFLKWAEVQNNIPHFCSHINSIKILFQILEYIIIRFTYKLALSTICFNFKNQLDQFDSKALKEPKSGLAEGIEIYLIITTQSVLYYQTRITTTANPDNPAQYLCSLSGLETRSGGCSIGGGGRQMGCSGGAGGLTGPRASVLHNTVGKK